MHRLLSPLQSTMLVDFLTANIDAMMTTSQSESVVNVGDLNQHMVKNAFQDDDDGALLAQPRYLPPPTAMNRPSIP